MRKEAVNTFSEGLIMDLNPLTTPANVMTSCLNGTIITFNGNEFVLLNDMGNGRVETAYLPAGYVPVGIKEHGGIIYVASYNPLTNKSQIGSFPSPERNISSNEVSLSVKVITPADFESAGTFSTTYKLNLFEGAEDLVLRSGDKFSIVISGEDPNILRTYISNYLNVDGDKVISPKNKTLTLKACIIDANNNLRDITPQLKRIDVEGKTYSVIEFKDSDSQLLKENSGFYALPTEFLENMNLDEYRKNRALNVYNNKVFGELYIVATLNTILRVDFSITGSREDQVANLQLMMTYYYNCPDGFYNVDGQNNKDSRYLDLYSRYLSIYGRSGDFALDNLIKGYSFSLEKMQDVDIPFSLEKMQDVEYLESENLYKVTNTYDLPSIPILNLESDVRAYTAIPEMTYALLSGLTINGTINLAKLGSGEINLNNWRYYCTLDTVTLTWGFEAYLKEGLIIEDLQFEFYDAESGENTYTYSPTRKYSYNGVFTDVLGYTEGLLYKRLYLVVAKCKLNTKVDGEPETRIFARWLLTTHLYNEQYFSTTDYAEFTEQLLHSGEFTGLNDIDFDINYKLKEISNEPSNLLEAYTPDLSSQEDLIIMGYKVNSKTMLIDHTLQYKNLDKYPFSIPQNRYVSTYVSNLDDSTITWDGVVTGTGEIPELLDVDNTSHDASEWAETEYEVKHNVLLVSTVGQNRILIRYKAPSFIMGKKFDKPKDLVYTKALSTYGNRMDKVLGGDVLSGITPPFAVQLIFRERQRSGHRDYHGYGYFPIQNDNGSWKLLREESSYDAYITRRKTNRTVTYYASNDWTTFIKEGVKVALGRNPIVLFMTFNTCSQDAGDYFKPRLGHMRRGGSNIKSLILWYNGTDYGMVKGFSTSISGGSSMLGLLLNDLNKLIIRQAEEVAKTGFLIDPNASSYVKGGNFRVKASILATLQVNPEIGMLPEYLLKLDQTISTIISNAKVELDPEQSKELERLMTFNVNEQASLELPIEFEDYLVDMTPTFSGILLLSDNPIVSTPVIVDGDIIYQECDGLAINEFQIYVKTDSGIKAANTDRLMKKYSNSLVVKMIDDDEYHLVPKTLTVGSPQIDAASDGSSDSLSILSFTGIKMVNLQLGLTLM